MSHNWKLTILEAACFAACGQLSTAQIQPTAVLEIDGVNCISYENDVTDYAKLATDPNPTAGAPSKNFSNVVSVCDLTNINGAVVKGTVVSWNATLNARPNPTPGAMIADITRSNIHIIAFEILQPDGTPIGSIMGEGYGGGAGIPGAPLALTQGNNVVSGGTGAFLGVRGQWGTTVSKNLQTPLASVTEDPANRRLRQGGAFHYVIHLIPGSYPAVVVGDTGPVIVHSSDYSPVTAAKPAVPGEILTMIASGLGPTRPGVDPGKPFPASPLQPVNGPVQVLVNGVDAPVLYAGGYPNTTGWYQMNFRVPEGASSGAASLQVLAAWIPGPSVSFAIR